MKRLWKKTVWLLTLSLMAGTAIPACAQDTESLVRNLVSGKGGNYLDDQLYISCLLYTSDAADEPLCYELRARRTNE